MIKNVIFDIGNVLLDFCWKDHIARFGFQGEKADRIAQAMMLGPIWPKLDLGLESDEDILEQFVAHTPELEQEIRSRYFALTQKPLIACMKDAYNRYIMAVG